MKKTLLIVLVILSVLLVGCKKTEESFNITYNLDGGVLPSGYKETFTESELPLSLLAPTKEANIFLGWYETSDFSGDIISSLTQAKDYTLYALWEEEIITPISYDITYNLNGGVNSSLNKTTFTSEDLPITLRNPSRQYFEFLGWYLTSDFTGAVVTSITSEEDVTLYAKWDQGENIIDYDLGGGSWPYSYPFEDRASMVSDFIADFNVALSTSTTATTFFSSGTYGKDVASFFTNPTYQTKWGWMKTYIISVATSQSYSSVGLLNSGDSAIWRSNVYAFLNSTQKSEYPISANFTSATAADGFWNVIKISPTIISTYVEITEAITLISPVRAGFNFVRWIDDASNTITVIPSGTTGYFKVTAVWEEKIYPSEIVINSPLTTSLDKDDTWDLNVSVLPLNAEELELTMTSSNDNIASISEGVISTHAYGTVSITITSVYNSSATTTFEVVVAPTLIADTPVIYNSYGTYLDVVIKKGETFDLFDGIYAYTLESGNITDDIEIIYNGYSNQVAGKYTIVYEVLYHGNTATLERNITVNEFMWVGHRGCSDAYVSNSMGAFEAGIARGYKALECDIRVTSDNQFIIFHNAYLNDASGEKVLTEPYQTSTPESKTLAQLQAMTVTQTRSTSYPPAGTYTASIATLGDYLDLCKDNDITAVIEIKWTTGLNSNDTSKVGLLVEYVKSKGWYEKSIFMTSMRPVLDAIRTSYSDANLQWLCGSKATYDSYKDWAITNKISLDMAYGDLTQDIVNEFHNNGLLVNSYTLNTVTSANVQINYGVDMITTDYLYHDGAVVMKKFS